MTVASTGDLRAGEMFIEDADGRRTDDAIHEPILSTGKPESRAASDARERRLIALGMTPAAIEAAYGGGPANKSSRSIG